jgi:hypothetical protein
VHFDTGMAGGEDDTGVAKGFIIGVGINNQHAPCGRKRAAVDTFGLG